MALAMWPDASLDASVCLIELKTLALGRRLAALRLSRSPDLQETASRMLSHILTHDCSNEKREGRVAARDNFPDKEISDLQYQIWVCQIPIVLQ